MAWRQAAALPAAARKSPQQFRAADGIIDNDNMRPPLAVLSRVFVAPSSLRCRRAALYSLLARWNASG